MQNDDSAQVPLAPQCLEQHSPAAAHALPVVLQLLLSALQVPPVQSPLQQELLLVQAWPSEVHWVALQDPLTQLKVAQSVFALHPPPEATGCMSVEVQVWVVGSHLLEQQVLSPEHASPVVPQLLFADESGPPTDPSAMSPPPPPPARVVPVTGALLEPPQLTTQSANTHHHEECRDMKSPYDDLATTFRRRFASPLCVQVWDQATVSPDRVISSGNAVTEGERWSLDDPPLSRMLTSRARPIRSPADRLASVLLVAMIGLLHSAELGR